MFQPIWFINIVLIALAAFSTYGAYTEWSAADSPPAAEQKAPAASKKMEAVRWKHASAPKKSRYEPIIADSLFNVERKELVEEETETKTTPEKSKPGRPDPRAKQLRYFGSIQIGKSLSALVGENRRGRSAKNGPRWLAVGDVIAGFTVQSIEANKLVLENRGKQMDLKLVVPKPKRKPTRTAKRPTPTASQNEKKAKPKVTTRARKPASRTAAKRPSILDSRKRQRVRKMVPEEDN